MDALILALSLWGGPTQEGTQQICGPLYVNTDPKVWGGRKYERMIYCGNMMVFSSNPGKFICPPLPPPPPWERK